MALIRWRPGRQIDTFRDMLSMQDEINRLFDMTLGRGGIDRTNLFEGDWAPAVDVYESVDRIVVKCELPGMTDKDVEVEILGDTLTVKGEKKAEDETKGKSYHRLERIHGSFHRSIALPSLVDGDKAKASFKNGILEIEIPKREEAKPKQIKVGVN